ncbi:MAG: PhnD/SsuA/transferrin family substrate-binding protein [Gammaproteobacteria bacterium]|jgi:phosphonate transport system substrate-binding protein|nr:PhnD/SsuA/transferrin family substrate-binding protein [Gammaproteobacteria bacterium]
MSVLSRQSAPLALLIGLTLCWPVLALEPLRLGVINERPDRPAYALGLYGPLNAYLDAQLRPLGQRMGDLVIARSLDEMAVRISDGTVDLLLEGVMPTLKLRRKTGRIDVHLLVWRKGQRQYHTVFFARRESSIQRIEQLRGKVVVFESPRSTSAYDVPRAALIEAGLEFAEQPGADTAGAVDGDRVRFLFAGSELNQAYWVHAGRAHAGAFNNGDWERTPEAIKPELRIFHRTRPILRWLFSFAGPVDPALRAQLVEILNGMHQDPEGRAALAAASRIAKFEPLTSADRANLTYWDEALERLEAGAGE